MRHPGGGPDLVLVGRLRDAARAGSTVFGLIEEIKSHLGRSEIEAMPIVAYFRRAFGISLLQARMVEAHIDRGHGFIDGEGLDAKLLPIILGRLASEAIEPPGPKSDS